MISVIIPTLNAQKYIEKLINKLKEQKLEQELEIIVIDSASDDNTVQIAVTSGGIHQFDVLIDDNLWNSFSYDFDSGVVVH